MPSQTAAARAGDDPGTLVDILRRAGRTTGGGVVDEHGRLAEWGEIAALVDRLASTLHTVGVRPGERVAVLLPKSLASFVAMHAVLRAGAVAVPLNPLSIRRIISPILEVTAPQVLVSTTALVERAITADLDVGAMTALVVDDGARGADVWSRFAAHRSTDVGRVREREEVSDETTVVDLDALAPAPDDDAYIIFTSGSTGRPKGMVHTHRSGLAYATAAVDAHELDPTARLAGTAPLHFDMSTLELYAVPLAGATALTITEAEQKFPASLGTRLADASATHLYAVPTLLHRLRELGTPDAVDLSSLRHIAFAGEPMGAALLRSWMDRCPGATFLNAYGPAETNVVTSHRFPEDWDGSEVPIGRPWPNVHIRIVGGDMPEPAGASGRTGELVVAAPTCMRGYWRRDDETAAATSIDRDGVRWYHTGDVVRVGDDGALVFCGRRDNQVKVRGVRIEVEAVEHVLCSAPGVAQALVGRVVDTDGVASLVAWVVPVSDAELDVRAVARWCRARVVSAALPTEIVAVPVLPVTPNGKLDRSAVASLAAAARSTTEQ